MRSSIRFLIVSLTFFLGQSFVFAQEGKTDSLRSLLQTKSDGFTKAEVLIALSEQYIISGDFTEAKKSADEAFVICEAGISNTSGEERQLFLREKANAYNMIAIVYRYWGEYPMAIENHFAALKIREEIGDKKGIARSYLGLGSIYRFQGNYKEALSHYAVSLNTYTEIGFKWGIANSLIHIGDVYRDLAQYQEALENYLAGQKVWRELGNKKGIAESYNSIGLIYSIQGEYAEAMKYYYSSLEINDKVEYKDEIIKTYINLGLINTHLKQFAKVKNYLDQASVVARSIGSREDLKEIYKALSEMEKNKGNYKDAYEHYKTYILFRDSLVNQSSSGKIARMQVQYNQEKKDALAAEENKRQKVIAYSTSVALILVLLLAIAIFRGYRQKQRSNLLLSDKNKIIEEKNRNITDSISYAKRIQEAIMPPGGYVNAKLPENFILYTPKDIVAGDFYWMEELDQYIYIAAADSTGHGVPGAMVSVVCSNALNRAVKEFGLRNTGEILDKTRELVIETFERSDREVKDGMDISLLRIKKLPDGITEMQWSGAYNPIWYFNDGFHEIKANKQPVGKHSHPAPFTSHLLTFSAPVSFYLSSDGYADQFSPEGKKLMTRKFKELLTSIQHLSMQDQGKHLSDFHDKWKGETEQTDDVLVIGLSV